MNIRKINCLFYNNGDCIHYSHNRSFLIWSWNGRCDCIWDDMFTFQCKHRLKPQVKPKQPPRGIKK